MRVSGSVPALAQRSGCRLWAARGFGAASKAHFIIQAGALENNISASSTAGDISTFGAKECIFQVCSVFGGM